MRFKVRGGTTKDLNTPVCSTCSSGRITTDRSGNIKEICCNWAGEGIKLNYFPSSCTAYTNKTDPQMYELEEIAWILNTNKSNKVGFTPPKRNE